LQRRSNGGRYGYLGSAEWKHRLARAELLPAPTRFASMTLSADLVAALVAGLLALLACREYARSGATPRRPSDAVARAVGESLEVRPRARGLLARRLDREVASGFLLTLALAVTLVGGLVLGILAVLVRRVHFIQHLDNSVAAWGYNHRSATSTVGLHLITDLGSIEIVVALAAMVALIDFRRTRSRSTFLFLALVLAGMELAQLGVKDLVGRVRPTLDPAAARLGPSFPSGHSATAAAFYAAAALIIGRGLRRPARHVLIAAAIATAVAVAGSRVLLDLHWLSDVIGGLALGWAWFAICGIAFGGRMLRFGAGAELAEAVASGSPCRDEAERSIRAQPVSSGVPRR
jgi:membrane-associated phospholipid phosphatase